VAASASAITPEQKIRESLVDERLGHRADYSESMDLTRFMHGAPARLLCCQLCGLLWRDEAEEAHYADDVYDSDLMKVLYPRFAYAFENKRRQYRPLLRPAAEVLEVGSHLGGFLQVAEEWGWRPTGLDIGLIHRD
jgi:hypothetical protein